MLQEESQTLIPDTAIRLWKCLDFFSSILQLLCRKSSQCNNWKFLLFSQSVPLTILLITCCSTIGLWPLACPVSALLFYLWHHSDTFLQFLRSVLRYSSSQATIELCIFGLRIMSSCGFIAQTHKLKSNNLGMIRQLIAYLLGKLPVLGEKYRPLHKIFLHSCIQRSNIVNIYCIWTHSEKSLHHSMRMIFI